MAEILIKPAHQTTSLEPVESIRDLSVLVDERLSFSEHMQDKINKAYAMLGVIKWNFKYRTVSKNFKLHITVQDYGEVSFRLLKKRRHGEHRKGSEKGN